VIVGLIVFFASAYTVVPPYEAHVVVSRGKGRKVYSTRAGYQSSYWRFPIIQRRAVLPLENVQITVDDIPLRDKNMAKFEGDVVSWLNIEDPLLASERIGASTRIEDITADVQNVIKAVTRNMSMYWTIIDIMTKRKDFSQDVEKAVNEELGAWGMKLVELEVIHFADIEEYTVVKDLEERQATVINAETRKLVATQNKEATMAESNAKKEEELKIAENEEAFRKRQLEKDEAIGVRDQSKEQKIAVETQKANEEKIEAERTLTVGKADIEKQAVIKTAEGQAEAAIKRGKADADVTRVKGEAEGDVIKAKGFAEADSTDRRAEALKKYNEAGIGLEVIKASQTVQVAQADAWARAMEKAAIKVYAGGGGAGSLFGIPLSPQGGFSFGAFSEIMKEHGIDVEKIAESLGKGSLPIIDLTKVQKQPSEKQPEKQPEKKTVK
jgi:flotillin